MKQILSNQLFLAIMTGIGFGLWPIIAGRVKTDPANTIITAGFTLVVIGVVYKLSSGGNLLDFPPLAEYKWLIFACLINAIAYIGYCQIIANYVAIGSTVFLVICISVPILVGWLYGAIELREKFELTEILAVFLILIGIILLKLRK